MPGNIFVTEFSSYLVDAGGALQMAATPALAKQIVASGATSAAFNAATRFIRVHADSGFTAPGAAQVEIGNNPVIVAASMRVAINQTEYFKVNAGDRIAVGTVAQ